MRVKGFLEILNSPPADDLVGVVQHDHGRCVILSAFVRKEAERHNRDAVAFFAEVGDGAIKHDGAVAAGGGDGVGLEAMAVRLVANEDFLEGRDADGLEEFLVNGHAALVVHIRIGDDRAVDFRAEKMFEHRMNLVAHGLVNQHSCLADLAHFFHGAEEVVQENIDHMPLANLDIHTNGHPGLKGNIFVAHLE